MTALFYSNRFRVLVPSYVGMTGMYLRSSEALRQTSFSFEYSAENKKLLLLSGLFVRLLWFNT